MQLYIHLDFKTILAIFLFLVIIFIIFSDTNSDMKIIKKIKNGKKKILVKNPHAIHPMPIPVPKPYAMPFPIQSNAALMGGLKVHENH